jgi:hypothetical protein
VNIQAPISAAILLALSGASAIPASAQTVSVSARCNIYGAGHATPPDNCSTAIGSGISPVRIDLPPGATFVEFAGVSGTVLYCPSCTPANDAEGNSTSLFTFDSLRGISGISVTRARFFEAVFLGPAEPADPAPPALTFTNFAFTDLSPAIAQHFYVGDGLTGTGVGALQRFHIPAGATRLFMGFSDGFVPCVGAFDDNSGAITANVIVTDCTAAPVLNPVVNQTACPGGAVAFDVTMATPAHGPYTFQWRGGGVPINTVTNPSAATATLVLGGAAAGDPARYDCVVTNPCGSTTSNEATLTICIGDFNCDGGIDGADVGAFFDAWESGDASADVNADGGIDGADVNTFFEHWEAGC